MTMCEIFQNAGGVKEQILIQKGLLSKSDVMSRIIRTMARARFLLNAVPYARSVCQTL